jgi:glycosyltransferase involved in cell wall biosynthesis
MFKATAGRSDLLAADRVYAVSDFVRARLVLKGRMPDDRIRVIPNGIDLQRFAPNPPEPLDNRRIRIFTGARASVHKGIEVLVHATERLRSHHGIQGFEVTYAGDGPTLPALRALVAELDLRDCFHLLGEVPSTEQLQKEADIIVVPSIWGDACPSSVSEGLASGKPVVATRVGGVPEIVGDEHNAVLVEPSDPDALADALARLIRDPECRRELGRRGRARAEAALDESRYHAEVIAQMLSDCGLSNGGGE